MTESIYIMLMSSTAWQILFVLFVFQKECRGIKCYQCSSKKDKDCSLSKVDFNYLKQCPATHRYCRKAVYKYYFAESRDYSTTRECAQRRNAERECYRGRYTRDSYQLVCECEGSGCNRSSTSDPGGSPARLLCRLAFLLGPILAFAAM